MRFNFNSIDNLLFDTVRQVIFLPFLIVTIRVFLNDETQTLASTLLLLIRNKIERLIEFDTLRETWSSILDS